MRDLTIESLPENERDAALYHLEWLTDELRSDTAAREFLTLVLKKLGPQKMKDESA